MKSIESNIIDSPLFFIIVVLTLESFSFTIWIVYNVQECPWHVVLCNLDDGQACILPVSVPLGDTVSCLVHSVPVDIHY